MLTHSSASVAFQNYLWDHWATVGWGQKGIPGKDRPAISVTALLASAVGSDKARYVCGGLNENGPQRLIFECLVTRKQNSLKGLGGVVLLA